MLGRAPRDPETVHLLGMGLVAQAGCRIVAAIRAETVSIRNDIAVIRSRPFWQRWSFLDPISENRITLRT
jgi:hypothetical protein